MNETAMHALLDIWTRAELKAAWLALTNEERARIRWSPVLARHARYVLDKSNA